MISRRSLINKLGLSMVLCACSSQPDGGNVAAGAAASSAAGTGNSANCGAGTANSTTSGGADAAGGRATNDAGTSSAGTSGAGPSSAGTDVSSGGSLDTSGNGGALPSAGSGGTGEVRNPSSGRVVGYFAQWGIYQRGYRVKNIVDSGSAAALTVINYAFGNIVNGECVMVTRTGVGDAFADYQKSFMADESVDGKADTWDQKIKGNFNQLKKLKALNPKLKVMISLGGWTWSKGFSDAALTAESRSKVVKSCIDLYIRGNLPMLDGDPAGGPGAAAGVFDGIDIDWEYPAYAGDTGSVYRNEDTQNFTLLLAEFRRQLTAIDPKLLLTIAGPAGKPQTDKLELSAIQQHLDWINIMTYDMHGAWDATGPTNFHAPLYTSASDPDPQTTGALSIDAAVTRYLNGGVPPAKITVGVPFYGRGWTGVGTANHGLYQTATGPARGTYEAGIEDYRVLAARNAPGFHDDKAGAYWTFDGTEFWSYDDPQNIALKTAYVQKKGLGGVMVWSLDGDTKDGVLMRAVAAGMAKP